MVTDVLSSLLTMSMLNLNGSMRMLMGVLVLMVMLALVATASLLTGMFGIGHVVVAMRGAGAAVVAGLRALVKAQSLAKV